MSKWILFLLLGIHSFYSFADSSIEIANKVKQILISDLEGNYLNELENTFGLCGDDKSNCILDVDNYKYLSLPKKQMCFPYTLCGYYQCMEEKYQCESVGVQYFTKLAHPTCNQYVKNVSLNKFSKAGIEWIYNVMVCLQKGLTAECEIQGHCNQATRKATCEHIVDFTLKYHPGCYINSGIGVCHLPLSDKLSIWNTVKEFMTPRERQEAYKVIFSCLSPK